MKIKLSDHNVPLYCTVDLLVPARHRPLMMHFGTPEVSRGSRLGILLEVYFGLVEGIALASAFLRYKHRVHGIDLCATEE